MLTDRELDDLLRGTGVQLRQKQGLAKHIKALLTNPSLLTLLLLIALVKMIAVMMLIYCILNQ